MESQVALVENLVPDGTVAPRSRWRPAVALTGVTLLAVWALWTVHADLRQDDRIRAMAGQMADLAPWSASGFWLAAATRSWEPALQTHYDRLFPADVDREDLYLALTTLARSTGIEPLTLRRLEPPASLDEDDVAVDPLASEGQLESLIAAYAPQTDALPGTRLRAHRLEAAFVSDYAGMVRFLDALPSIPRALVVKNLRTMPARRGLTVTLELEFYVQRPD